MSATRRVYKIFIKSTFEHIQTLIALYLRPPPYLHVPLCNTGVIIFYVSEVENLQTSIN